MMPSNIPYCDEGWNVVTGCTHSGSPGCDNCYAKATAERFPAAHGGWQRCKGCSPPDHPKDRQTDALCVKKGRCIECLDGHEVEPVPFSTVLMHPDRLSKPEHWRKPRVVLVSAMGDLFHPSVSVEYIEQVFLAMGKRYWDRRDKLRPHTWLVLTKRAERMRDVVTAMVGSGITWREGCTGALPPNLWLGVTVCNQAEADEKIPLLLSTPAAHYWCSVEPMLGPVDLSYHLTVGEHCTGNMIDQVIAGAESLGPRPGRFCDGMWLSELYDQCKEARVPCYVKQAQHNPGLSGRKLFKRDPQPGELAWRAR